MSHLAQMLWRDAGEVDAGRLPVGEHLKSFAAAGFYGASAPPGLGGLGLNRAQLCEVVEELASSCLASTFVWAQHFRLLEVVTSADVPPALGGSFQADVVSGKRKGGVALTGLMPGPARLRAAPVVGGWSVDGDAPWVSGWGLVDHLLVAARHDDQVVYLVTEAMAGPTLDAQRLALVAADATSTFKLTFRGHFVPDGRLARCEPYRQAVAGADRLRLNGSFALGVARRCIALLGPTSLGPQLDEAREHLDQADEAAMPAARAGACVLAAKAAHALAVARGSSSALSGDVAARLTREAAFLLVFGSRPAIKAALLAEYDAAPPR